MSDEREKIRNSSPDLVSTGKARESASSSEGGSLAKMVRAKTASSRQQGYQNGWNAGEHDDESKLKTVTRTFRLDERLNDSLESLSEESQITPSNLLNQILTQFVNWNRFVNTRDSPFITFYNHTLAALMESIDEEKLLQIARDVEAEATIDYIKFRWGKLTLQNFVRYLRLLSAYSNQGQINFIRPNGGGQGLGVEENAEELLLLANRDKYLDADAKPSSGNNGRDRVLVIIAIRHRLGLKWSKFIGTLVSSVFNQIDGVDADFELSNNSCFVTVKKNGKNIKR